MSSSNQSGAASNAVSTTVAVLSKGLSWGMTLLKGSTLGPAVAAAKGATIAGRFLAFTTLGRGICAVLLLLGTFTYFKSHFTALERHHWDIAVKAKQQIIDAKVVSVNAETRAAQDIARAQAGFMDRIFNVVADGIMRRQPPHPIEAETIDLINETRGKGTSSKGK